MANDETSKKKTAVRREKIFPLIFSGFIFIGFAILLFIPDLIGWNTSLFSQICNVFKGSFNGSFQAKIVLYCTVGMYGVLIVCTTASFFIEKKGILCCNLFKSLLALAAFIALAIVAIRDYNLHISEFFYNSETYLAINSIGFALIFGFITLAVSAIPLFKAFSAIKIIFLLFAASFFTVASKTFVDSYNFIDLFRELSNSSDPVHMIFYILAWVTVINLALSLLAFLKKKTAVLAMMRSFLVLAANITAVIALIVHDSFGNLPDYLGTLVFVGIAMGQFLFALFVVLIMHSRAKKRAALEDAEDDGLYLFDENNQLEFADAAARPSATQSSACSTNSTPDEINDAFDDAAQISFDDLEINKQSDDEVVLGEEIHETDSAFDFAQAQYNGKFNRAYEEFAAEQERKQRQEEWQRQQEQQKKQEEEWNTRREQQRRQEEEWQQRSEQQQKQEEEWQQRAEKQKHLEEEWQRQQEQQQKQEEEWQIRREQQRRQEKSWQEQQKQQSAPTSFPGASFRPSDYIRSQQSTNYSDSNGFIPDPFLSTLTPAEKDEFDRLFISRVYGDNKRLPVYRIGGDNREFFVKIFVFMGRYRNVMSTGLLEKIYAHSNTFR